MIALSLDAIPNQSFTAVLDNTRYAITIKETRGVMSTTIIRNDETIIEGARICGGTPLLPYQFQEEGNFFLTTANNDLPDYTKFGVSQFLIYLTLQEVESYRAGN